MPEAYWLDDATLDLETDSGEVVPMAGIQDVEIVAAVDIVTLFTADSIKPEAKKQQEFEPDVNIGFSKFDVELAQEWLGGDGPSATAMADTSDPQMFTIDGTFESVGGDTTFEATVTGITFEEMPLIQASRGEFVQWDLSGQAMDITNFDVVV